MFTLKVTEKASEMIKDALKSEKQPTSIRIFKQSGCCGPSLGMALDKPAEGDDAFTDQEVRFLIDKGLVEELGFVTVDFQGAGFRLSSGLSQEAGGGCCG